ncbi:hypothetical protein HYPSUDRAFT_151617 [Hypholoma sublateritium FD-334 SS-4]|uniref:Cytosine deaminase n=1 Tax=Hypholoma sublateritium (strain FD-334 SS-4) TaxID=945553 RepID=A0A0D2N9U1_HYPSF|nr:hypothetical protein HYPSUDRAFT_151617 [Hypholoma sublateritium FD-334 SS-4]
MPTSTWTEVDVKGMRLALDQAYKSFNEGGIPIGSAILTLNDSSEGSPEVTFTVHGAGHNEHVQRKSVILHGEMSALENAGYLQAEVYRKATLYTTLSPCSMCTGAILLYRIPRIVVGENVTYKGGDDYLRSKGVEVIVVDDKECKELMSKFIKEHPEEWNEDIGEV